MSEAVLDLVREAMSSPWVYAALLVFAALDAFLPVVPSESLLITAGVYAASGEPHLVAVVAAAAGGALLGDHVSYLIGRTSGGRLTRRLRPGTRRAAAYAWAGRVMASRGGLILVVARYVPGGRTAVTMTMGLVQYRLPAFSGFASIAAVSWGLYGALLGYLGGSVFEDDPVKGLLAGLGLALGLTAIMEATRLLRRRARSRPVVPRAGEIAHQGAGGDRGPDPEGS